MDDGDDWQLFDAEGSWKIWRMLEALEWKHLPEPGGLLDQDEALMEDLTVIRWQSAVVSELVKEEMKGGPF